MWSGVLQVFNNYNYPSGMNYAHEIHMCEENKDQIQFKSKEENKESDSSILRLKVDSIAVVVGCGNWILSELCVVYTKWSQC